ncbi:hypothetical protein D1872_257990 [compost metagenome]
MVCPVKYIIINVATKEIGITIAAIIVERILFKNNSSTMAAIISPNIACSISECTESLMGLEASVTISS